MHALDSVRLQLFVVLLIVLIDEVLGTLGYVLGVFESVSAKLYNGGVTDYDCHTNVVSLVQTGSR